MRGDGGFGNPTMYGVRERPDVIDTYGPSMNAVLQRGSDDLLVEAVRLGDETHEAQWLFAGFWYRAGTWTVPRSIVEKAGVNALGTNRRFDVAPGPDPVVSVDELRRGAGIWSPRIRGMDPTDY